MGRRLGGDVTESGDQFILVNHISRDFAADNFTENRFFGHLAFLVLHN